MISDLKAGFFAHGVFNLTPGECFKLCEKGAIIVDVREKYVSSFKMFKVEKVIYLPFSDLAQSFKSLPTDQTLIFADSVGLKSRESVMFMNAHEYKKVFNMAGGIIDWEKDGLPVTTDISYRLSGSCLCQLRPREQKNKTS